MKAREDAVKRVLILILMALGLISFGIPGFAATLVSDNFDSYTVGSIPPVPWEVQENGGSVRVNSAVASSSPNSVAVTASSDPSQLAFFGQIHWPILGSGTYEAYLRTNNVSNETLVMTSYGNGSGNKAGPWISLGGPAGFGIPVGHLAYFDGSSWHDVMAISNDTWYHIKIRVNVLSKTYDIYVDNMVAPIVTGASFWDTSVVNLGYIGFFVYGASSNPNPTIPGVDYAYVDNVIVQSDADADAAPVPTLSEWGMIILTVLVGLSSVHYLRRRRSAT
jgi:hypothetical protein